MMLKGFGIWNQIVCEGLQLDWWRPKASCFNEGVSAKELLLE